MIKELIVNLLNKAWSRKHEHGQSISICPFDKLLVVSPTVPQKIKGDSSMYASLFALRMFQTHQRPFYDHDYESNCSRVTKSFKFGPEDASRLKSKTKACILMLQSKRSEKRVNQVHPFRKNHPLLHHHATAITSNIFMKKASNNYQMTENYDIYLYSGLLRFWQSEDWMIVALAANR
jgi:hypothetical protein